MVVPKLCLTRAHSSAFLITPAHLNRLRVQGSETRILDVGILVPQRSNLAFDEKALIRDGHEPGMIAGYESKDWRGIESRGPAKKGSLLRRAQTVIRDGITSRSLDLNCKCTGSAAGKQVNGPAASSRYAPRPAAALQKLADLQFLSASVSIFHDIAPQRDWGSFPVSPTILESPSTNRYCLLSPESTEEVLESVLEKVFCQRSAATVAPWV